MLDDVAKLELIFLGVVLVFACTEEQSSKYDPQTPGIPQNTFRGFPGPFQGSMRSRQFQ